MQVVLLPQGWSVWLDAKSGELRGTPDTPPAVLDYLRRDDLPFGARQSFDGEAFHYHGPTNRAIQGGRDLEEAVLYADFRAEFGIRDTSVEAGPDGSTEW